MMTTLLRTKLYILRPTRTAVVHQPLLESLNDGLERGLTLVVAPVAMARRRCL